MATARSALMFYEGDAQANPQEEMTDSGDGATFESTVAPWSNFLDELLDAKPVIMLDGLKTGGLITPGAADDQVSVSAGTANIGGAAINFASNVAVAVARPVTDTHIIYSISHDAAGAINATPGAEGTSFNGNIGTAGGPPLIPAGENQLGTVQLSVQAPGPVLATEIKVGSGNTEFADSPSIRLIDFALGKVTFQSPLLKNHVGGVSRPVFVTAFSPLFSQFLRTLDWAPSEITGSSNSTPFYDGVISSVSTGLSDASFTVLMDNGIRDQFITRVGKEIWVKFQPVKTQGDHQLQLGTLFITRTNPVANEIQAACTMTPAQAVVDVKV